VEVEFRLKLREERRFESFDELRAQIARDATAARDYLASPSGGSED
jgi:riboflavin kinase/FMN adenylyltransferase